MGPNIQLGGLNEGLFKPAYQVGISAIVNMPPKDPRPTVEIIDMMSFCVLVICMSFILITD
jgi:hypothetical protein